MKNYDVCVVGGGPAGSTVATLIAKAGFKVILLEKELFPRHQIGESLLPATIEGICALLDVKEKVYEAGFYPKKGGTFIWGKSKEPWSFQFKRLDIEEKICEKLDAKAFQVERAKFDKLLLDNAISHGVEVLQSCCVTNVIENDNRVVGVEYIDKHQKSNKIYAKFIVDASGNRSPIAKKVGTRLFSEHFNNIAIYGYFINGERLPGDDRGNILAEAFPHGWSWYIPLSDELTSVGIVVDRNYVDVNSKNQEEIYYSSLKNCDKTSQFLAKAHRATDDMYGKLRTRLDYSYSTTQFWKSGLVLIGDAACFVDPVFSSGVHLATFSALLAARAINSCLREYLSEDIAFSEFESRYKREYSNFYNFLVAFYDVDQGLEDYFWAARKVINTREKNNHAFLRLVSGYTSSDISQVAKTSDYFSGKENISMIFDKSLPYSVKRTSETFDPDKFMGELRKEIVGLQANAVGINMENENIISTNISLSQDMLSWEPVGEAVVE